MRSIAWILSISATFVGLEVPGLVAFADELGDPNAAAVVWVAERDNPSMKEAPQLYEGIFRATQPDGSINHHSVFNVRADRFWNVDAMDLFRKANESEGRPASFERKLDEAFNSLKGAKNPVLHLAMKAHGSPNTFCHIVSYIGHQELAQFLIEKIKDFEARTGKKLTLNIILDQCKGGTLLDQISSLDGDEHQINFFLSSKDTYSFGSDLALGILMLGEANRLNSADSSRDCGSTWFSQSDWAELIRRSGRNQSQSVHSTYQSTPSRRFTWEDPRSERDLNYLNFWWKKHIQWRDRSWVMNRAETEDTLEDAARALKSSRVPLPAKSFVVSVLDQIVSRQELSAVSEPALANLVRDLVSLKTQQNLNLKYRVDLLIANVINRVSEKSPEFKNEIAFILLRSDHPDAIAFAVEYLDRSGLTTEKWIQERLAQITQYAPDRSSRDSAKNVLTRVRGVPGPAVVAR